VSVLLRSLTARRSDDVVRLAGELLAEGRLPALEPVPGRGDDLAAALAVLVARIRTAGLSAACEVTVPVDRLGRDGARELATGGVPAVLDGPPGQVDDLAGELPEAGVVVRAGEPGAEERCRRLADRHVRLRAGRGAHADLAFVRCLNVLMSAGGRPALQTADLRLIAIAGERAAWNGRAPASWEHVLPHGARTREQRRLVAAGLTVRVALPVRTAGGRS
jgi:proline dehydrogenase